MKKKIQILTILIIFLLSLFISNNVFAITVARDSRGDGIKKQVSIPTKSINPDDYEPKDLTVSDAGDFIDIANSIIGAIRIFGTVVAVVTLMALGLKYMLGSVQDKATYKETMIPYLIGAVMVFAIPNIIGIILDLVTQIKF